MAVALAEQKPKFEKMLPGFMQKQADRFFEVVIAASKNDLIAKCSPVSVIEAVVRAAQWGLLPDGVHGALVPYGQNCTFVPMYRGLVAAYRRSGDIKQVWADVVCEGDEFEYEQGMNPILRHVPKAKVRTDPAKVTHAYACARWKDGHVDFVVMSIDELEFVWRKSRAQNGPWKTDTVAMFLKTPVRRLSKFLPLSPEIQQLVVADEKQDLEPRDVESETVTQATPADLLLDGKREVAPVTRTEIKQELVPIEPETNGEAVREAMGIPIDISETWAQIADVPMGGTDLILSTLTPNQVVKALREKDPSICARVKDKLDKAHEIYANGRIPQRGFQVLALAAEQARASSGDDF
jgi:recombination protein RecT